MRGGKTIMKIREYTTNDCKEIAELFYNTVHTINAIDYSKEQLDVWATGDVDMESWNRSFLEHYTLVAIEADKIIGFGDITEDGYLDRLYVHKDFQHRGVATTICDRLETHLSTSRVTTHASITARPFFEKRGYQVIKKQQVERNGIFLTNYVMDKNLKSFKVDLK